jgi:hypothetical protein
MELTRRDLFTGSASAARRPSPEQPHLLAPATRVRVMGRVHIRVSALSKMFYSKKCSFDHASEEAAAGGLLRNGDLNRSSLLAFLTSDVHRCGRVVIGAAIGDRGIVVVR